MALARRMWDSPKLIPVLSVLTGVSLIGMAFTVMSVLAIDTQQERDRVASDINTCERVNVLRGQVVDGFGATEAAFDRILDVFLPPEPSGVPDRDARIAELRSEIDPILAELHTTLEGVEFTDCEAVVPGGRNDAQEDP